MDLTSRYERNQKTLSDTDQLKLGSSKVAIVGCGGLGGYIMEQMARLGVGEVILIDGDSFQVSNLNRQILATEQNLGQWKVEAAKERLALVNSSTKVTAIHDWFTEDNGFEYLKGTNLVCDALDNLQTRIVLEKVCHSLGIPLVFASIGGWYGLLGVSLPGDFTVARLFRNMARGIETELGNPAFTPTVLASLSVAEGVKILTGREATLHQSWLQVDLLTMEFDRFEVK